MKVRSSCGGLKRKIELDRGAPPGQGCVINKADPRQKARQG